MARVVLRETRRWDVIRGYIEANDWRMGAELGIFRGDTYLHLLSRCPNLVLFGIDLWVSSGRPDDPVTGSRSYDEYDLAKHDIDVHEKAARFGSRSTLIRRDTADAANEFLNHSLDFVFIDADHTYEGVKRDIEAWYPKVRSGGYLMGHDYQERFPGVSRAVKDWGRPYVLHEDSVWASEC